MKKGDFLVRVDVSKRVAQDKEAYFGRREQCGKPGIRSESDSGLSLQRLVSSCFVLSKLGSRQPPLSCDPDLLRSTDVCSPPSFGFSQTVPMPARGLTGKHRQIRSNHTMRQPSDRKTITLRLLFPEARCMLHDQATREVPTVTFASSAVLLIVGIWYMKCVPQSAQPLERDRVRAVTVPHPPCLTIARCVPHKLSVLHSIGMMHRE